MIDLPTPEELKKAEIVSETARIQWRELERFFASGSAIFVAEGEDLVEVGYLVASDNKQGVEALMTQGKMGQVSDQQAVQWMDDDQEVWAAVVKPWILVQPVKTEPEND